MGWGQNQVILYYIFQFDNLMKACEPESVKRAIGLKSFSDGHFHIAYKMNGFLAYFHAFFWNPLKKS